MALNINGTTGISGVDGSVSAPAVTGTDSNTGITFPSADTIKFATGGVERMQITNSGVSGTGIGAAGSGYGNAVNATASTYNFQGFGNEPIHTSALDSPNTTSATTYKIQWFGETGSTAYLNRTGSDSNSSYYFRTTSSITAMEIASGAL